MSKKEKQIKELLENPVYLEDSRLYISVYKALNKLSFVELAALRLIISMKETNPIN